MAECSDAHTYFTPLLRYYGYVVFEFTLLAVYSLAPSVALAHANRRRFMDERQRAFDGTSMHFSLKARIELMRVIREFVADQQS
jgi:hypothetical protein